ncbi:MAG: GTP cyclohydrolase I [Chloroflexi bacterium]|nr:GTP cyclohydrolase I [Chloroflexota bacterium]
MSLQPSDTSLTAGLDPEEEEFARVMKLHKRDVSKEQMAKFEGYVAEIFEAFGMQMHTEATEDTPRRYIRAIYDITVGYEGDPKLLTVFNTECHGEPDCRLSQVIEGPIHFSGLCEHHALPIIGHAYIGYIAHEQIIGISKLTRLVRVFASRFTVQERIGEQVANTLEAMLKPHGVAVYLEGEHTCTRLRGVREVSPITRTTVWRGHFANDPSLRSEFFTACGLGRASGG